MTTIDDFPNYSIAEAIKHWPIGDSWWVHELGLRWLEWGYLPPPDQRPIEQITSHRWSGGRQDDGLPGLVTFTKGGT